MIKLGVIGYGRRVRSVLSTIDRFNAGTRIVAVVDPLANELRSRFPEELAGTAIYEDADQMLDQAGLDGVLIGTRCSLHTPYAVKVLARDLPLFLEKPVATSWEQLTTLKAAVNRSRSPVVVSFPLCVSSLCETAWAIVASGAIGPVAQVQAVNDVPFYATEYYHRWYRDDQETGGLWMQKATHDFDYINSLVGQRPVRICAMEAKAVYRGDMPAGLRCQDCWKQEECLESPYNLFYRQGVKKTVEPTDWLCSFAVDSGSTIIQSQPWRPPGRCVLDLLLPLPSARPHWTAGAAWHSR